MDFTLRINGTPQKVTVKPRTLVNTMTSDSVNSALDKRSLNEKIKDALGTSNLDEIIRALWSITNAKTSIHLQNGILHLMTMAENPVQFAQALKLETGQNNDNSYYVKISLSGQYMATMQFDDKVEWDPIYFSQSLKEPLVWQLSRENLIEFSALLANIGRAPDSVEFQLHILELVVFNPDLANKLTLTVNNTGTNSLIAVSLNGTVLEKVEFKDHVKLDPVLFEKMHQTNEFLLRAINFDAYKPVFIALYCDDNSVVKKVIQNPAIVLKDDLIQTNQDILKMQAGERFSFKNTEFTAQVNRDLARMRRKLFMEEQLVFTHKAIQTFSPELKSAVQGEALSIYNEYALLPEESKNRLVSNFQEISSSATSSEKQLKERFDQLSETNKKALLNLIECDIYLSFKPEQLKNGDVESLAYIAQMSHQGTMVIAPFATRVVLLMMDPEGKANLNETNEKLSHRSIDSYKSDVMFSWSIQCFETTVLQASSCFHFETKTDFFEDKSENSITMKLTSYDLQIQLVNPEVAKISKRLNKPNLTSSFGMPNLEVSSTLPISFNMHWETKEADMKRDNLLKTMGSIVYDGYSLY
jgi:hypothetical protein